MGATQDTSQREPVHHALTEGQQLESPYTEITAEKVLAFAELSGDENPIHLSIDAANLAGLPKCPAHGAFVFSRCTGLAYRLGLLVKNQAIFRDAELKFSRPVFVGDSIKIQMMVTKVTVLRPGLKSVELKVKVINQDDIVVHRYTWTAAVADGPTN